MSTAGNSHGRFAMNIGQPLAAYVKVNSWVLFTPLNWFSLPSDPDTVLAPDVSFITRARWKKSAIWMVF